ncbi:hypothetical protein CLV42_110186 [Chitinophaga ginsengisoli]|uniref:Uncharacterized protein n=1 Tax=Chitinophaga ginsengisoli TaxID=363837 RepID=A0A2P8FZ82_9BACT|nr:hypothetical protein CLV42_110186 [Chitinophaga ginsengisoli]
MPLPIRIYHHSIQQSIQKDTNIMATHNISPEKADANKEAKRNYNLICSL